GIRDDLVTGVQTCALPISCDRPMDEGGCITCAIQILGPCIVQSCRSSPKGTYQCGIGRPGTDRLGEDVLAEMIDQLAGGISYFKIGRASCRERVERGGGGV